MRTNLMIPLLLGGCLFTFKLFGQHRTITGQVKSKEDGQPLIGVSVKTKHINIGTQTDAGGHYSLKVPENAGPLIFTYIGFLSQEAPAAGQSQVNVILEPDPKQLSEVVVTGVAEGTSRKKLSFALTRVDNSQLNTVSALDASQSLRGKVAGIQIDQAAGNKAATVYLRGAKSVFGNIPPLIVVDGFVTSLSLSDLNPQDIESIEVVKGAAAAALYGTRGEGGIIQVLTKKGKGNGRLNITVDNEVGISNVQRTPATSRYHHFKVNPDGSFVLNGNARTVDLQSNGYAVNLHPYQQSYDNVDNMLGNKPYYSNFIALSTATDKYNVYASFMNQYKGGVAEPINPDKRRTAKFNFGYRPNAKLEADITIQYYNDVTPSAPLPDGSGSLLYATSLMEPFIDLREKDANGDFAFKPYGMDIQNFGVNNPFYEWSKREYTNNNDNILAGARLKYHLTDHLSAEVYGSIQRAYYREEDYYPVGYQTVSPDVTHNNGFYGITNRKTSSRNGQAQLNYNTKLADFDLGATLKMVYEEALFTSDSASGYNLSAPVHDLDVSAADTRATSSDWQQTVNYGYFLNIKAGWRNKWFIDALGRLDKSSRFGANVGAAFFPRIAAAYRLSEDVRLYPFTDFKLRAAYGKAGSLPAFGAKDSQVSITGSGGISYQQRDNTDLKRAVTEELELGFDAVLLGRINIQANYARSTSTHDFIQVPAFPPTSGSAKIYGNLGAVKSNSIELEINGNVLAIQRFSWTAGLTFSRVRSRITDLGGVPEFRDGTYFRKAEGVSPYAFYGYSILTDLSQLQTDKSGFVLNSGNGKLRPEDYTVNQLGFVVEKSKLGTAAETPVFYYNAATGNTKFIGDAQPDFQLGFSNTFNAGPFTLYALLDWKQGGQKYDMTVQYLTYQYRSAFSDESAQAGLPLTFTQGVFNGQTVTDYWLEKSSYVSLREVSIGYALPVERLGLSKVLKNARLALTGRNLYTWTKYQGVTPEGLYEFYPYPAYRTYSAKLSFNL